MTLIVRELGGGAWSQRASIALLLERALSISVAQRPTLSVTGDRQLPSVQLGLAAELEARRQSRGEICPHGSEAGISGEVDLLLGVGVQVVELVGPSSSRDVLPPPCADHAIVAVLVQDQDLGRPGSVGIPSLGQEAREAASRPQRVRWGADVGRLEDRGEDAGRADQLGATTAGSVGCWGPSGEGSDEY